MSFLSRLNPVNVVKEVAKAATNVAEKVVDKASDVAEQVVDKASDAAVAVADKLDSTLDAGAIWGSVGEVAGKGAQVIHTTAEAIASRLVPRALVEKLPGFRADVDSNARSSRTHATEAEAKAAQTRASAALLDVNNWGETLATTPPQRFELHDAQGNKVDRPAQEGDYVKITPLIPGTDDPIPGLPPNWVQVEAASATPDKTEVVVRPSQDPTGENPAPIAHVFDSRATNTFSVERQGNQVHSSVRGRDEYANDGAEAGGDLKATLNRGGAEALWGAPGRYVGTPLGTVTASPQQLLWDSFTTNLTQA